MFAVLARLFLLVAAVVTGWFVQTDAVNFSTIEMTVALLLFGADILLAAFWPHNLIRKLGGRSKPEKPV